MKDKDQHLLWEAYITEQKSVAGRTPPKDKLNKGDFLPKKVRDEINDEEDEDKDEVEESSEFTDEQKDKGKESQFKQMKDDLDEEEDEDVQEEGEMGVANAASEGMGLAHKSPSDMINYRNVSGAHLSPGTVVLQALADIISTNMAGLDSPEDMHEFDLNTEFESAKKLIIDSLSDITLSKVKLYLQRGM
jgi:hypothetical protein